MNRAQLALYLRRKAEYAELGSYPQAVVFSPAMARAIADVVEGTADGLALPPDDAPIGRPELHLERGGAG